MTPTLATTLTLMVMRMTTGAWAAVQTLPVWEAGEA